MSGADRRLRRLEALRVGGGTEETEAERLERLRMIHEGAAWANRTSLREERGPVFETTGVGVFCTHDGRPVTAYRQTLAELWYWQTLEEGGEGLVHDEDAETFYSRTGELAISRDLVNLEHFMGKQRWAHLGDLGDY